MTTIELTEIIVEHDKSQNLLTSDEYRQAIEDKARELFKEPTKDVVAMAVEYLLPVPEEYSIGKTIALQYKPCADYPYIGSLLDVVIEALEGIAYESRGQVSLITGHKRYGRDRFQTTITIRANSKEG